MKYNYREIGERIRNRRKEKGYSQESLLEALSNKGIKFGRNSLSNIENGIFSNSNLPFLATLCEILECDVGYILGEYDFTTKELADICRVTGLSEDAAARIISMNNVSLSNCIDNANIARCGMNLINILLEGGTSYLMLATVVSNYREEFPDVKSSDDFTAVENGMGKKFLEYTIATEFVNLIGGKTNNAEK